MTGRMAFRLLLMTVIVLGAQVVGSAQEELPHPIVTSRGAPLGSISGRVVLPSGHPVSGNIRVTLSTPEDPGLPVFTDSNGNFSFNNLPEGNYTIEVFGDRKLYDPVSETVRLIRSARTSLTLYLREKAKPQGTSGKIISAAELDQNVPPGARKEYERAVRLASQGRSEEAIERLKRALAIYPDYLIARNDLGVQYLNLNRLREAIEQFEAAIEINDKAFNPRLNLGIALVRQNKYSEAIDHLRLANSLDSSSPAVHLYLGIVSLETDELPEAERELRRALSIGGQGYSIGHFYLGMVFMKSGEREKAARELRTYLQDSAEGEQAARARQLLEKLKQ